MAIQDIQKYIEANKNQYPLEVLLDNLRKSGYPEAEIQVAMQSISGPVPAAPPAKKHRWLTITLLTLAAVFVGVSVYLAFAIRIPRGPGTSRDARRISDVKQIQLALELYYDAQGKYPNQLDELASPGSCTGNYLCIPSIPRDPVSGAPYHYEKRSECSYYMSVPLENPDNSALSYDANPGNSLYEVEEKLDASGSCPSLRNAPLSSPFGTQATSPTVFSPAKGDKLQRGATQKIKWNPLPFVPYVKISVNPWVKPCNASEGLCPVIEYAAYIIASKTENDGAFDWTVGKDESAKYFRDGEYYIRVVGFHSSGSGIIAEGVSDRFSIFQTK